MTEKVRVRREIPRSGQETDPLYGAWVNKHVFDDSFQLTAASLSGQKITVIKYFVSRSVNPWINKSGNRRLERRGVNATTK